jgi:hypothetical protein
VSGTVLSCVGGDLGAIGLLALACFLMYRDFRAYLSMFESRRK